MVESLYGPHAFLMGICPGLPRIRLSRYQRYEKMREGTRRPPLRPRIVVAKASGASRINLKWCTGRISYKPEKVKEAKRINFISLEAPA